MKTPTNLDLDTLDNVTGGCRPAPGPSATTSPAPPTPQQSFGIGPIIDQIANGKIDLMALLGGIQGLFDSQQGAGGYIADPVHGVAPTIGSDLTNHDGAMSTDHAGDLILAQAAPDHVTDLIPADAGAASTEHMSMGEMLTAAHQTEHTDLNVQAEAAPTVQMDSFQFHHGDTGNGNLATEVPIIHAEAASDVAQHGTPFTGVGAWHQLVAR